MVSDVSERERNNRERDREIQERALRDDRFRQSLLTDPRGTLEREFGAKLPDGMVVHVHEETDDTIHLVLPSRSSGDDPDLGDLGDAVFMMPTNPDKKSKCCTCGSSTHQTFNI